MSNEAFAAMREQERMTAFVEANRSTVCVRCSDKGVIDRRGLCFKCSEIRLASMRLDPDKEETARRASDTIYTLLTGPGGHAQVQGADLNYCNSAVTARANLASTIKALGKYESHLIAYPNSTAAWETYSRMYDRIDECVRQIKHFEGLLKKNWPSLKTFPIHVPIKLERAAERTWLDVS